jgi:hypothetical protein
VLLLAVVAAVWVRSGRRVSWALVLVWVVALGWAITYTRTVAIAAAMAAPLFVAVVSSVLPPEAVEGSPPALRPRRVERMTLVASLVVSGVLAAIVLPATTATPDRMPSGFDAALDRLPEGTVVFDEYGLGGYLRYRHPDLVPVIDERTELFTVGYVEAYLSARGARPGWTDFVERTGATAALVPADSAIADALPRTLRWQSLGRSGDYVLLVEPRPSS